MRKFVNQSGHYCNEPNQIRSIINNKTKILKKCHSRGRGVTHNLEIGVSVMMKELI